MITKRIHCTVYLEGVNVNFNSVQIQEGIGNPPTATVSFPADSGARTILPKTVIHVFYRDDAGQDVLIFMGELSGSGITFTPDKRAIQLTFSGFSQNWNTNIVIPMDLQVRTMLSNALYAQITPTQRATSNPIGVAKSNVYVGTLKKKPFDEIKSYISFAESSGNPYKTHLNTDGTLDTGLYQINDIHLIPVNEPKEALRVEIDTILFDAGVAENAPIEVKQSALLNPTTNEKVAAAIYKHKGLQAWSTRNTVAARYYKDNPAILENTTTAQEVEASMMAQSSDADNKINTTVINFMNITGASFITPILNELIKGKSLVQVFTSLVDTFSTNFKGVYWSMLSKAFDFKNMVKIVDHPGNTQIESLIKHQAVMQYINSLAMGVLPDNSISVMLNTILNAAGFDYCEIAAPTDLGGVRAHILIKPKTHFFPPLKHNLVVDDNIAQLSFTRAFDNEPTRMLTQTLPFMTTDTSEFEKNIMGVMIPGEVNVPTGIKATIDGPEDYANLKMFGLSQEEQCRGVVLISKEDHTAIENAFLTASLNDNGKPEIATIEQSNIGGASSTRVKRTDSKAFHDTIAGPPEPSASFAVRKYWINMASSQFYDRRHAARAMQVNSPFSPYRMVGFPGVIISKYFPKDTPAMLGMLASITSNISADGDASQALSFTHCRFVDGQTGTTARLGFLDDDTTNLISWYSDYANRNSVNKFYEQFTGDSKSAVIDEGAENEDVAIYRGVKNIIYDLNKNLSGKDMGSIQAYILNKTKRKLVSRETIDALYPSDPKKLRTLVNSPKIVYQDSEIFPYVKERRERVLAVFDVVKKGQ